MGRIVKEYDERHAEFLAVAQRLFYQRGYEQTSVQAIIDAVGVAKGTFYHYFDSKEDLLDELVEGMLGAQLRELEPLIADPALDALTKLNRLFAQSNSWKLENRDLMKEVARVLYRSRNARLLNRVRAESLARVSPVMAQIIQQGVDEGVFEVEHVDETAEILISLGDALSSAIGPLMLGDDTDETRIAAAERKVSAYERALERLLAAPRGSIQLLDPHVLRAWFV